MERRLAEARRELSALKGYDYLVVNDDLETAVRQVEWIVRARRLRRERSSAAVDRILGETGEERDGSSNG
jgi:guanylate kinase